MDRSPKESNHRPAPLKGLKSVSLLTLVSRITGLARDVLMASAFGTGWILDAFTLAFRVPNMFRRLFGEGAMTAAFLPEFLRTDQQDGRAAASQLFIAIRNRLFRLLLILMIIAELSIGVVYLTFTLSTRSSLLCELLLILIPYVMFVCLSGVYVAALNGVQHFVLPAFAPVLLNLIWFAGGLIAIFLLSDPVHQVRLVAGCIVVGGIMQLVLLRRAAAAFQIGVLKQHTTAVSGQVSDVFQRLLPVLFGLSIAQINGLVDSILAWTLCSDRIADSETLGLFHIPEGTAGALYLGQRLFQFPMGVFAVALGTVLFPRFSSSAQSGRQADLRHDVTHGLQLVTVVGIPASAGLWLLSDELTDLLFRYHSFDARSAKLTSEMIAMYGLGVWTFSGLMIANRVFFAQGDQRTPTRLGVIAVAINLICNILLLPIFGGPALPLGSVIAGTVQMLLAIKILNGSGNLLAYKDLAAVTWRSALGTCLLAVVVIATCHFTENLRLSIFSARLLNVALPIFTATITYAACLTLLQLSPKRLLSHPYPFGGQATCSSGE